jgi:hypothetical protein
MTMQFKNKVVPFITRVHCFAHRTNLVVITLSNVLLLHRLEDYLTKHVFFFPHNPNVLQNFKSLQIFLTPKATRFYGMSRLVGF